MSLPETKNSNIAIRGLEWFIEPSYQNKNYCYERCLKRYKENNPKATFEELVTYSTSKERIYNGYFSK